MSALWTALIERSHTGLAEDYIKLMESKAQAEADSHQLYAALKLAMEVDHGRHHEAYGNICEICAAIRVYESRGK